MARTDIHYNVSQSKQFDRLGHPGRYFKSKRMLAGGAQLDLTGSNYGYGALMVTGSGAGQAMIELSGGGIISGSDLASGVIYELSPAKIYGGTAGVGGIYVFKKAF
tara:strand:+ start:1700 stop:2017 length:318 start_codon:yes stop_codon:yes gene_type:complete